jgi:hypothetical protein
MPPGLFATWNPRKSSNLQCMEGLRSGSGAWGCGWLWGGPGENEPLASYGPTL